MKKKYEFRKSDIFFLKALAYPFFLNFSLCAVTALVANGIIQELWSLIPILAIFILSGVIYGFVKGNVERPFLYNVVSAAANTVFAIIFYIIFGSLYSDWSVSGFFLVELVSIFAYLLVCIADSVFCFIRSRK